VSGGRITLAIYIAVAFIPVAFGQSSTHPKNVPPTYSPIPPAMEKAFTTTNPLLEQMATVAAPATVAPVIIPSNPLTRPIVIRYGQGGKITEHRQQFAIYQNRRAKVEVRGPCYSACTLLLAYVEPERLCIAEGAFMAFHAVRSIEHGEMMVGATYQLYYDMPAVIRTWIDHAGGWQNLPLNGYWTMYDRQLWALGYPKCI
jgi:hypothetical protein